MPKIPNQSTEARRAVGAALRQLRERRGMSQSAVADRLGVNRSTVSVRESGSENIGFSLDALQPHLDALGAHLRLEFVDGPGDVEVSAAGPLPPVLANLAQVWGQLDHRARDLVVAAADMALRTVGELPSEAKKFG